MRELAIEESGLHRLAVAVAVIAAAAALAGCGGTLTFSDQNALAVSGTPPPPPPAPDPPKRVEVTADKIVINEKIQFDFNKATIKPESHSLLDEVTGVIKQNPQLKKISIEGHTDSEGSDSYNLKLSDERANAVMKYLVEHGVEQARLAAKGFGETKPIASNDNDQGREQNRRVEFMIVEQDQKEKTP